ncbi:MAG: protein BatD [Bacteroidales bacterium]|nr:protein BatD [Bacteroidales bacterium]
MRILTGILFFAVVLNSLTAKGQEISVEVEYPEVVRAGEQFTISWTINSGEGQFTAPSFDGFYKLMGPQTSFSSSTQIINGKITRETKYTYVYYLQAVKEGKYVIGPGKLTLKNKTFSSDSARIEVISGTSARRQPPAQQAVPGKDEADQNIATDEEIFVRINLNKRDVYLGEHIVATVKLYTKVDLSGINEIKYPSFNGFLKTEIETPPLTSLQRENINGVIYGTGVIQQFLLYPQVSGELTIEPVQVSVLVRKKSGVSDPFFGDFFATYTDVPRMIASQGIKINVKSLPGTKPSDFSGVTGKLSIKASLSKDSVKVNDAINLKISVSGSGNLRLAGAPKINLPPDIETYDPKITEDLKNSVNGTTGQKTFDYLLIPRHHGDFTIPPVTYSYFDIGTGKYEQLSTQEFSFHVERGSGESSEVTVFGGVSKEDVKYLGKDIRFISSKPGNLRKQPALLTSKRTFYSFYIFSLLMFFAVLIFRKEHIRRTSDISAVRNRKAAKVARMRLAEAHRCLKTGMIDKFYEEMLKGIWGYLSDKLSIPVSGLTRTNAFNALKEKGFDEDIIDRLAKLLDRCEFARYAPAGSDTEAVQLNDEADKIIRLIENFNK